MEEEVVAIFVPIVMFIAIAVVMCVYYYLRHRTGEAVQKTVRTAIEQGQELTPEILERLGQAPKRKPADLKMMDLRRGVILISVGLGIAAFGALVGEEHAMRPLLAIGALPFLIGVAYLGLWKFGKSDKSG